ncbi:hypothetical protein PZE06_22260 [Robertmurraya sp. DFI.2.37]|uniref:hypothetical protein n=1 Tax=Robertmurraya sp. DFI.2.37 TaxID=3031819 RepID=UPI00177AB8C8|nr:hypothetical protein [Robertmurraya sp. DFI.2.37]MDF1510861.1 hypothetical protein [Robertmurraya sp. DFI.2.37]
MAAQNAREAISVKIDVDISDALTGLKALQREARETTKALRELEGATVKAGRLDLLRLFNGGNAGE